MIRPKRVTGKISRINVLGLGEVLEEDSKSALEVPFSLPNEIVDYVKDDDGKANNVKVKVESPYRKQPSCPQFQKCGGCSLQHASKNFVTEWKESVVAHALREKDLYPHFRATYVTPERSRRRAVFSGRRTKRGVTVGFKSYRSNNIVSIQGCIILDKKILEFSAGMEKITSLGCTRSTTIKIHVSTSENGLDVCVSNGKPLNKELQTKLTKIAIEHDLARLSWEDELIVLLKPPIQKVGELKILPPAKFFMQACKEAEKVMVEEVGEVLKNENNVIDLFSGFGTFALPLSRTKKIFAVEKSSEMLTALELVQRKTPTLKFIRTSRRNLHKNPVTADELFEIEGAVVNPPRSGAYSQCSELAKSGIKRIAIVSCNPLTFARDAEALIKGFYNLDWIKIVDQFRWSHHIELIAKFSRKF